MLPYQLTAIILFLSSSSLISATDERHVGQYTIVGAQHIRFYTTYHVAVSVHNATESTTFRLTIENGAAFSVAQEVTVQPWSTATVPFEFGELPPPAVGTQYKLIAEGLQGIQFRNETLLHVSAKQFAILVQTDKALYKPGDLIQFRALAIDEHTRPFDLTQSLQVHVQDGAGNRVKQWSNVSTTYGVFSGEFRLSNAPVLGTWRLTFEALNELQSHTVVVAEYVLPTFETFIETAENVLFEDGKIFANIRGRYTFGKPVHGDAIVTLRQPNNYNGDSTAVRKVIRVANNGAVEFDLHDDLKLPQMTTTATRSLQLDVTLREEFTGRQRNATATIRVHRSKFSIVRRSFNYVYVDGQPLQIELQVLRFDKTPVRNGTIEMWYSTNFDRNEDTHVERHTLDHDGRVKWSLVLPPNKSGHFVMAKYLEITESFGYFPSVLIRPNVLKVFALTTTSLDPTVGENVTLELESKVPLKYFTYQVIARGDVFITKTVQVEGDGKQKNPIVFPVTFAMLPSVKVIVYTIRSNGSVDVTNTDVALKSSLLNTIKLEAAVNETQPGSDIDIKIITPQNSFVGLLAVDQRVLLQETATNLSKSDVIGTLAEYGNTNARPAFGEYCSKQNFTLTKSPFEKNGLYVLSNLDQLIPKRMIVIPPRPVISAVRIAAFADAEFNAITPADYQHDSPSIRKEFPETWIFNTLFIDSANGEQKFRTKIPDTITSWVLTAFSLNKVTGLGITKASTTLTAFKPFFVSVSLPNSVKHGETVSIPIIVFNYLEVSARAQVTLHNVDGEFEFADLDKGSYATNTTMLGSQQMHIDTHNSAAVTFVIRPIKVGPITIKVTAVSEFAGDGVQLILPVHPEGVPQYENKAVLVDLRDKSSLETSLTVDVPADAVPDSTRVEVSAIGDVMGSTIKHLDKLIFMPSGCGEQNMLNFAPNIVIRNYLKSVDQLTDEVDAKSRMYMEVGYQRQLSYRHDNGSFSAFGQSDASGSTWLTAFVARSFRQAAEHIPIEERIINESLSFLHGVQAENGSFPEVGTVIHRWMQSGVGSGVALTAYTLLAFLENRHVFPEYNVTIEKAIGYVVKNLDALDDVYAMSVAAYALQLADHSAKVDILRQLDVHAITSGDHKHWGTETVVKADKKRSKLLRQNSVNTEITSYALLAHIKSGPIDQIVPIMKWLLAQRNEQGGFSSTQDTIVGLQALATVAAKIKFGHDDDVRFTLEYGTADVQQSVFEVNAGNANVLQQFALPGDVREVNVTASGHGFSLLSLSYRYYLNETGSEPRFKIEPKVAQSEHEHLLHLDVCVSYIPSKESIESNMAVVEVEFPSGYTLDSDKATELRASVGVKKVETKNGDTVVVLYFNQLGVEPVCPVIEAVRTHTVDDLKPAAILVYDYYDTTRKSRVFYNMAKTTVDVLRREQTTSIELDV